MILREMAAGGDGPGTKGKEAGFLLSAAEPKLDWFRLRNREVAGLGKLCSAQQMGATHN
jgi:hypothetical protein